MKRLERHWTQMSEFVFFFRSNQMRLFTFKTGIITFFSSMRESHCVRWIMRLKIIKCFWYSARSAQYYANREKCFNFYTLFQSFSSILIKGECFIKLFNNHADRIEIFGFFSSSQFLEIYNSLFNLLSIKNIEINTHLLKLVTKYIFTIHW